MWYFLAKNKQVAAMVGLLGAAAAVVIVLATKGGRAGTATEAHEETEDVSTDPRVFATFRYG